MSPMFMEPFSQFLHNLFVCDLPISAFGTGASYLLEIQKSVAEITFVSFIAIKLDFQ